MGKKSVIVPFSSVVFIFDSFFILICTQTTKRNVFYICIQTVSRGFQTLWEGFSTLWTNCLGVDRGTIEDVSECE